MYPKEYLYAKDHEWVKLGDASATVGITDFAQSELGDIVYLELPEVGKRLEKGQVLGTVESVKAVSEIYAPIAGVVTEVNSPLVDAPEKLNADPHGEAWLVKLKLDGGADTSDLMDAAAYEDFIKK